MGWQVDEFGKAHDGTVGVLMEDGTEPKRAYIASVTSGSGRETTEWWAYNGKFGAGRAAYFRGACSCGWRGENRYPIDWESLGDWPEYVDEPGPREDWDQHIEEVEAAAIPLPEHIEDLLERLDESLQSLEADSPLAALRAVAAVERIARRIGWQVAFDVDPDDVSWDQMGKALGLSGDQLKRRLVSYKPHNLPGVYRADTGEPAY
jgi:hypothetical protein